MYLCSYDFISPKKAGRLRLKRFKKLPELHRNAYNQGVFLTRIACYEQKFYCYNQNAE
jgi:predicted peroxiredoxin